MVCFLLFSFSMTAVKAAPAECKEAFPNLCRKDGQCYGSCPEKTSWNSYNCKCETTKAEDCIEKYPNYCAKDKNCRANCRVPLKWNPENCSCEAESPEGCPKESPFYCSKTKGCYWCGETETWNKATCLCEVKGPEDCPKEKYPNFCTTSKTCRAKCPNPKATWNSANCRCEQKGPEDCLPNFPSYCESNKSCYSSCFYNGGQKWNPNLCQCECPKGTYADIETLTCVAIKTCEANQFACGSKCFDLSSSIKQCCSGWGNYYTCPQGKTCNPNNASTECVVEPKNARSEKTIPAVMK